MLTVSALKEVYEDVQRHKSDEEANTQSATLVEKGKVRWEGGGDKAKLPQIHPEAQANSNLLIASFATYPLRFASLRLTHHSAHRGPQSTGGTWRLATLLLLARTSQFQPI